DLKVQVVSSAENHEATTVLCCRLRERKTVAIGVEYGKRADALAFHQVVDEFVELSAPFATFRESSKHVDLNAVDQIHLGCEGSYMIGSTEYMHIKGPI